MKKFLNNHPEWKKAGVAALCFFGAAFIAISVMN